MNLFNLAGIELQREGKDPNNMKAVINKAVKIRRWLNKHGITTARRIMQGATVYNYSNQIKTYARV
jgi:hypothetical protein